MPSRPLKLCGWALGCAALLSACGGGSDDAGSDTAPSVVDRIEPLDTSTQAKAQSFSSSALATASDAATPIPTIRLGALPQGVQKSAPAALPGQPQRMGQARSLTQTLSSADTAALLQWQPTPRGTQAAALRFVSQGALGVRLGVWVQALPAGALLRFAAPSASSADTNALVQIHEISAAQLQAQAQRLSGAGATPQQAQTYWSPDFASAETTLEIEIPAAADPGQVAIAVPQLAHVTDRAYPSTAAPALSSQAKSSAGTCNTDIICHTDYLDQGRSVMRVEYIDYGAPYHCTGTLLNDASASRTPYVLTAHHCISTEWTAATVETDWFYRAKVCGVGAPNPLSQRIIGGATLLHTSASSDVSLVRLNEPPPAGVVYAGSYFGTLPSVGTALATVHHPAADLQKISFATLEAYSLCSDVIQDVDTDCRTSTASEANFLRLAWQQGVVESGSSGAPAFVTLQNRRYVVGQLFGGTSSCENPQGRDYYGRFDVAYRSALAKWLNP